MEETRDTTTEYLQAGPQNEPFMLFVRSMYTHSPYRDIFRSSDYVTTLSHRGWQSRLIGGFVRGLFQFERIYLDPIIDALRHIDQLEKTIFIICSYHGDMFWNVETDMRNGANDEEIWRHQLEPYNALIKVPLLISGANLRGEYNSRFRLIDLLPTLLEELNIEFEPSQFDGTSIRQESPRPIYSDSSGSGSGGLAFQNTGSKLLASRRLGTVSYAITEDEYENQAMRVEAGPIIAEFTDFLQSNSRNFQSFVPDDEGEALERRLRSLGYIE